MADLEGYFERHLDLRGPAYVNSRGHRERKARCPFHDDQRGSLGVDLVDGVLHCFGCNWSGNVRQFADKLGVKPPESWQPSPSRGAISPRRQQPPAPTLRPLGEEARQWLADHGKGYSDVTLTRFRVQETTISSEPAVVIPAEGGALRLYFWGRPKERRWQSWPTGAGGSVVKGDLDGPEVVVCEGEWDALAAYDAGFKNVLTGTTGAGSFPRRHLGLFEGKTVTIAYDNDEPGRKGAEKLAGEILAACREATVKVAEVPAGAWEGKDVSDFLAANSPEEFKELLASAKPMKPGKAPGKAAINFHLDDAADLLHLKIADPPHVVARLLPEQGGLLVVADGGVGKSMGTLDLALRVALGSPFLGFDVRRPRKVAVFSLENSRLLTAARLQHMARGLAVEPEELRERLVLVHDLRLNLANIRDRKLLLDIAGELAAGVYIFDPAISFLGSADENKSADVRSVLDTFTQVSRQCDAAVVVCHHLAKDGGMGRDLRSRIRGASDFYNWADVVLTLERKSPAQAPDVVLQATCLKCRAMREPAPFLVRRSSLTFLHEVVEEAALCSPERVVAVLKDTFGGEVETKRELIAKLMELTGASDKTVKKAIAEAVAGGLLRQEPHSENRRAKVLRLAATGEHGNRPRASVPPFGNPPS